MVQPNVLTTAVDLILGNSKLVAELKYVNINRQEQELIERLRERILNSDMLSSSEQQTAIGEMEKFNRSSNQQRRKLDSEQRGPRSL